MPLEIFALITPIGIALIVLIVRYSGLSKASKLNDGQTAIDIFQRDFAGEKISGTALVCSDQKAAFLNLDKPGSLGLVESIGDRFITRILRSRDISSFDQQDDHTLFVKFHDFTHPNGRYKFDNSKDLSEMSERLTILETIK